MRELSKAVKCLIDNNFIIPAIKLHMDKGGFDPLNLLAAKKAVDNYRFAPKNMVEALYALTEYVQTTHGADYIIHQKALAALNFIGDDIYKEAIAAESK